MPSSRPLRVLIADDQSINRKLTARRLERLGFTADTAENGEDAVEAWSRNAYDLIFMDCHMPQMDGFRATQEIRRREGSERHTPIVALTASAFGPERERCIEVGMDEYVLKPLSDSDLNRILTRYVVDMRPAIDSATTAGLQQMGEASVFEAIDLYLAEASARMEDIRAAVTTRNAQLLFSSAHGLKSSSGNIGAARVQEICGELEAIGRANAVAGADRLLMQLEMENERANQELRKMRRA